MGRRPSPASASRWITCDVVSTERVSVDTHLTEVALPVQGDRVQLQQVVLNLILNALEAMGSVQEGPRELSISTEHAQGNGFLVTVRDTGPGIDPENIDRVRLGRGESASARSVGVA